MNGRILELAKNPELFQIKDLELLNGEIHKHPFIQSLRALHLLGTHRLKPENYAQELSITAAYTTDKKILYQLINSVEEEKFSPDIFEKPKTAVEAISRAGTKNEAEELENKFTEVDLKEIVAPRPVFVNGELNRILFEGEEDFLERQTETIDLASTLETGQIVTQKAVCTISTNEPNTFSKVKDLKNLNKETILKEEIITAEENLCLNSAELYSQKTEAYFSDKAETPTKEAANTSTPSSKSDDNQTGKEIFIVGKPFLEEESVIEDSSTLSFHATAAFLPEVKITSTSKKEEMNQVPKPILNKHELEMQRLIAEVEARMKATKTQKNAIVTEEISASSDVNFSETQSFNIAKTEDSKTANPEVKENYQEKVIVERQAETEEKTAVQPQEMPQKSAQISSEKIATEKPAWKPMSVTSHTPDAFISTKKDAVPGKTKPIIENISLNKAKEFVKTENQFAERPIFNVSFFTQNVSVLKKEHKQIEIQPVIEEKETDEIIEESNVPQFINTWQSWLKIDRTKDEAKEKLEISITEIKNKVIENFIEKEPRISKLKEESDFVIKERNDDISHLMTETLANLYTEQKLYAKAIRAFGLLSEKHPDKKDHFDVKIKQIKELRQNK